MIGTVSLLAAQEEVDKSRFMLDSGSTIHVTTSKDQLENYTSIKKNIGTIDDEGSLVSEGTGELTMVLKSGHKLRLKNVHYVPMATANIISVKRLILAGFKVTFDNHLAQIHRMGQLILSVTSKSQLWWIRSMPTEFINLVSDARIWHRRLGHANHRYISKLPLVAQEPIQLTHQVRSCDSCLAGKLPAAHIPKTSTSKVEITEPLQKMYMDTVGPIKPMTKKKEVYATIITDGHSKFRWIVFVNKKSEITLKLINLFRLIQKSTGMAIKGMHSDQGTEFTNGKLRTYCQGEGIAQHFSTPHTPEQNGTAERTNRTVFDGVRSLLNDSGLPNSFWGYAAAQKIYVLNRTPMKHPDDGKWTTPYEILFKRKPTYDKIHIFGSEGRGKQWAKNPPKLAERGKICRYLGVDDSESYIVLWKESNSVSSTRTKMVQMMHSS